MEQETLAEQGSKTRAEGVRDDVVVVAPGKPSRRRRRSPLNGRSASWLSEEAQVGRHRGRVVRADAEVEAAP